MKVNPIGIQSYQQLTRRDPQPASVDDQKTTAARQETVKIEPKGLEQTSRLAVKAPTGTYAERLSPEERQALDLLFGRFRDAGRFGAAYRRDMDCETDSAAIGRVVDVKV